MDKETKKIKGAMMTNYLLEKSRVIQPMAGERNYHVFYHLLKGADQKMKADLGLENPKNYDYLKKSDCYEVNTIDDKELFLEVSNSFNVMFFKYLKNNNILLKVMKFHSNEIKGIWNIVAAILHLGNLTLDEKTLDTQKNVPCTIENEKLLGKISELLCVDAEKFKNALTLKTRKIGGQIYKTCMTKIDCLTLKYSKLLLFF